MIYKTITASFLLALLILVGSCNSDKKVQQALFDEVMLLHDEVMPKMGNIRGLASELSLKADSLAQDSIVDNSLTVDKMRMLSKKLQDANEGMMEWMRQFEQVEEGTPHGEVIEYLTKQRQEIQKVRDDMLNSKDEAEKYLLENN